MPNIANGKYEWRENLSDPCFEKYYLSPQPVSALYRLFAAPSVRIKTQIHRYLTTANKKETPSSGKWVVFVLLLLNLQKFGV